MKKKIDIGTLFGLMFGLAAVFGSFLLEGGTMGAIIMLPAMVIVFGGTFATALIGTPMKVMKNFGTTLLIALYPPSYDYPAIIEEIVKHSMIARKEGLLTLERHLSSVKDRYLLKMLRYLIDGIDINILRSLSEMDLNHVSERHQKNIQLYQRMGGYSPTMGIIGTVMGLIATLANAGEDPNQLIRHIASAFIATLWGVFMANIIWLPIADKLKSIDDEEQLYMSLISEGVIAIQEGEIPSIIRSKLRTMITSDEQVQDLK
ncbi:MAG TPA: chemotaxis protein MotA [Bacteroidetes bacterium]|nr:chemotaxis protein MotA [Bacteroidota bacterium]